MAKKKKQKATIRLANLEIFKCDVVLIICDHDELEKEAAKFLSPARLEKFKEMIPEYSASREGSNYPIMGGGSIIWCAHGVSVSVLVHEIAHAAFYALRAKDTPLSEDTEEVYAYTFESLYKQLVEKKLTT